MVLTHELLTRVEEESATAPAVLLRHRIALILGLSGGADHELRNHAQALLLKLERRLREECNGTEALRPPAYLAPELQLPTEELASRRRPDPVRLLRSPPRTNVPIDDAAAPCPRPTFFAPWSSL